MPEVILVLNAGSSSLKFSVFPNRERTWPLLSGAIERLSTEPHFLARDGAVIVGEKKWPSGSVLSHEAAIDFLFKWGAGGALKGHSIAAVGHRVVHGGVKFAAPVRIDSDVLAELQRLIPLAPLHQPHSVAAVKAVAELAPNLPQVACFDTSFHHTQPAAARAFALPRRFAEEGVRRYGFHGLSYEYIASALPEIDPAAAEGRTVVAHLGNGASMCAMHQGRSVATTMSFTPLDGLMMGTRCGDIDPGVLLYLMDRHDMNARSLEELLCDQSGLLGVSGISSDMRSLLASSEPRAVEAIDLFIYRIKIELGSLAAALGGIDAFVFTGGIGENAASIRARVCRDADWLGLELDEEANKNGRRCISARGSRVSVWAIPTNEELMIAAHTRRVLASAL